MSEGHAHECHPKTNEHIPFVALLCLSLDTVRSGRCALCALHTTSAAQVAHFF